MPELRKDPVTGRWVIIATERANRPQAFPAPVPMRDEPKTCPFCPGHEDQTPPEVLAYRKEGTLPDQKGWWVRVVPNRYPALSPVGEPARLGDGMYDLASGVGAHEVVIETPDHDANLGTMEPKQIEEILWAYRARCIELSKDSRIRYVMIFRNEGQRAGASVYHPHTQIIGLPIVPMNVKEEISGAQRYYSFKERCIFCDMIRQEMRDEKRLVEINDHFVAFAPFAPRFAYETWILPRFHRAHFEWIEQHEVSWLAKLLSSTIRRLQATVENTPYNLVIHSSPSNVDVGPHYHWHMEIMPALSTMAGFEWGSGFFINAIPPETAAEEMREQG